VASGSPLEAGEVKALRPKNSKSEAQNPKQYQMTKNEKPGRTRCSVGILPLIAIPYFH